MKSDSLGLVLASWTKVCLSSVEFSEQPGKSEKLFAFSDGEAMEKV